jgi:chemotaxis protein methyltransferase CheR
MYGRGGQTASASYVSGNNVNYDVFKQNLSAGEFEQIKAFIEGHCGIKLPPTKKQMVEGRLRKRLRKYGYSTYDEYLDFVFNSEAGAEELVSLIDVITTNKTDFYREPGHFEFMRDRVLPYITKDNDRSMIKVWSAGCSTGEEPYTLAMELLGYFEGLKGWKFELLATDISTEVLQKALTAIYPEEKVEKVPLAIKKKYFLRSKDRNDCKVRLKPFVRKSIRFERLNLMNEKFVQDKDFDIIFCRNVIIYFDRETQERILQKLVSHLKPGRFLFLGHSETIHGMDLNVETVAPTVYRKL